MSRRARWWSSKRGRHACPVANSLLKTLEEPPSGTVFILSARSVCGVLPTIASRCAIVPLMPGPDAPRTIAIALSVDDATARILADLSGGFPDEARRIRDDAEFMARRAETIVQCQNLLRQSNMAISAFADFLENNKEHSIPLLCIMQSYLRDIPVMRREMQAVSPIRLSGRHSRCANRFTSGALSNMINVILDTERRFLSPVNSGCRREDAFWFTGGKKIDAK